MKNETTAQILRGVAKACELGAAGCVGAIIMNRKISKLLKSRQNDISEATDRIIRRAIEENLTKKEIEELLMEQFQFLGMMWVNRIK